ncbi:MAG: citrate lyase holo-[Lachnospiraceae bacterium]|nr:citrate lyase holo-[acyl-carrier protein] synthase [Lachnospiraceae bacterium]
MKRREALIKKSGCTVLSMTMNIPGAVKDSPLIRRTFHAWLDLLCTALEKSGASDAEIRYEKTGPELLWALDIPARELKRHCIDLEGTDPAG